MPSLYAGVVRVSHMGARKEDAADFHAQRDQVAAMTEAVAAVGGELEVLAPELDVSGGLPLTGRPSLRVAVEGVEAGRFAGIVVAYQSRLGRDTEYEEEVWRRVEAAGGTILLALDGIDTTTVDGKMIRRIRSAMNTAERERHTERFDDLRRWATAAGIWQRRQTPRGYRRCEQTRRLVPNDDADLVRDVFRRAPTATLSRLADELAMTTSGVRALLRNRVYLGELKVGEHVNVAAHEALIDLDTFEAAQTRRPRPPRGVAEEPAMLAGLARCAGCGHTMTRSRTVYTCHGRHSGGRCPSPAAVTARLLDEHVEQIALVEAARMRITDTKRAGALAAARDRLNAAERELGAYLDAVSAADIGAEAFGAGARSRQAKVQAARDEVRRLVATERVAPRLSSGVEAWKSLNAHERNAFLRALLEVVIVRRGGGRGSRTPLDERVQVLAHGAGIAPVKRGGAPYGLRPLAFLDLDDERVLRVPSSKDAL